jgi:hypothetical protein
VSEVAFQQDQANHLAAQNVWRTEYYNLKESNEADKKSLRNKIIASRITADNARFVKFASDICSQGTGPDSLVTDVLKMKKRRYDGLEARLIFNRLRALIYIKTKEIEKKATESTDKYSLHTAEQDLMDLEWPLILYRAIDDVEKMKSDALKEAASGVPEAK